MITIKVTIHRGVEHSMLFIDNQGITDPRINLAIEEYALKYLSTDQVQICV